MDFLAVEMRHLGGLASAGLLWAALPKKISHQSHISLQAQAAPLLQNPLHGIVGRDLWAAAQLFSTECLEKQGTEISW